MTGPELQEKDFIHEPKNANPLWLWAAIVVGFIALIWGGKEWVTGKDRESSSISGPFANVSNRDFSLFLWQNPEYMRVNVSTKMGYLEGFQYLNKVSVEPEMADKRVVAPPKVVFLYHVWNRLLGSDYIPRKIPTSEFKNFLNYCEEWKPEFWSRAPSEYVNFIKGLPTYKGESLEALPMSTLPVVVRQAFVGWKNYAIEGAAIDAIKPTFQDVQDLLGSYPHYARNFWRNIQNWPDSPYLKSMLSKQFDPKAVVPENELAGFLKVALFNFKQSDKK